jgi:hypothetical protein
MSAEGIQVEGLRSRAHKKSGVVVHTGRVAEGQVGYRAMKADELEPMSSPEAEHGYHSRGTFTTKIERGSGVSTMFSHQPLTPEEMEPHGYTHQVEVDLSGLPFRSLKAPESDHIKADQGLGLGVTGEMDWGRIKRMWHGDQEVTPDDAPHIGAQFKHMIFEDTGRWPRGS